jgi:hypothetical protein
MGRLRPLGSGTADATTTEIAVDISRSVALSRWITIALSFAVAVFALLTGYIVFRCLLRHHLICQRPPRPASMDDEAFPGDPAYRLQ